MQILLISALVLPVVLYLSAWFLGLRGERATPEAAGVEGIATDPREAGIRIHSVLLMLAVLAHLGALHVAIFPDRVPHFGFAHILSAASWVGALLLWIEGDNAHVRAMRALVLPLAAALAPMPLLFPGYPLAALEGNALFVPHLLVGVLAYAVMLLAALHALLMAMAEKSLHDPLDARPNPLLAGSLERLPPLLTMERLLFRLLAIGFALLTLTALSGMLFSEEIFGRPFRFDHKTVLTLLAWAVFGLLLIGRRLWGWRGQRALRLTLTGFVVLVLGYAGSRFVLEVILHRTV
ncbi:MAG: cytochrome c biogenesis protein CcsA [Burkholderiaceae bacterium]